VFVLEKELTEWSVAMSRKELMQCRAVVEFDIACTHLNPVFDWRDASGDPYMQIDVGDTLHAIAATTLVDKISKVRFGHCAFENCPRDRVFKLDSEHMRLFCSHQCATSEGQRKRRAEKTRPNGKSSYENMQRGQRG